MWIILFSNSSGIFFLETYFSETYFSMDRKHRFPEFSFDSARISWISENVKGYRVSILLLDRGYLRLRYIQAQILF